jgi:hypothetical protein
VTDYGMFNAWLGNHGFEPKESIIAVHTWSDRPCLETIWLTRRAAFEQWQAVQSVRRFSKLGRKWLVSLARLPGKRALFLGVYGIGEAHRLTETTIDQLTGEDYKGCWRYDLTPIREAEAFSRCVTVGEVEPSRYWWPRADEYDKPIVTLLNEPHDPAFPGAMKLRKVDLSELPRFPRLWRDGLTRECGVYVMWFDDCWYVGMADGADGFLGRWEDYRRTGDGGNMLVMKYLASHPHAKVRAEAVWPMGPGDSRDDVQEMEALWKARMAEWFPDKRSLNGN